MKRIAGLDIIKALAAFFVIALHFLLNTNFYQK
jgi:surface polysaccharide O-acyltransferase-like enzyme